MPITLDHRARQRGQGTGRDGRACARISRTATSRCWSCRRAPTSSTTCASSPVRGSAMGARVERFDGPDRRGWCAAPGCASLCSARSLASGVIARRSAPGGRRRPGCVRALGELFAELQVRRVTPARLQRALDRGLPRTGSARSRVGAGRRSTSDYQPAARGVSAGSTPSSARCARSTPARAPSLWGRTPVLFYGFDDLTRLQLDTIETLGRVLDARGDRLA